jgi:5'(3')-deoxyribonucleotidase
MNERKFVLGVDLDGVVADFYEGLRPIAAEWLGVPETDLTRDVSYGLPEWKLDEMGSTPRDAYERLHRFAVTQRELFRKLRPIGNAPAVLRRLAKRDDIRIRIITHRLFIKHFHQEALSQTVAWLDHYGIPYWDICFMESKAAVGADLYIEDAPKNVEALRSAGCDVLVFGNSTNKHVPAPRATDWDDVQTFVVEKLNARPPLRTDRPGTAKGRGKRISRRRAA